MSRFEAGAAKLCIDPTPDMFPFPPFWGVAKEAVYASMFVRALALKNEEQTFVFVTFDAGNGTLRLRLKGRGQITLRSIAKTMAAAKGGIAGGEV